MFGNNSGSDTILDLESADTILITSGASSLGDLTIFEEFEGLGVGTNGPTITEDFTVNTVIDYGSGRITLANMFEFQLNLRVFDFI